jgi:hypothetical protein
MKDAAAQRRVRDRFAEPSPESHQVHDRAGRIVDAHVFPRHRFEGGQPTSKRNTCAGGRPITGGCACFGTAICAAAGISSVKLCTYAAEMQQASGATTPTRLGTTLVVRLRGGTPRVSVS